MTLNALLVLPTKDATWRMDLEQHSPPYAGLGIRIGVCETVKVQSVNLGDPGYPVTCIVELEDADSIEIEAEKFEALGFRIGP
jgi:hypothetical protein